MESKLKKERLRKVIERLEEIENSKDMNVILTDKDLKILEAVLGVKPYSKKNSQENEKREVRRISGNGFKKKKASCNNNKF